MNVNIIETELNKLYKYEMDKYISECDHWKSMGYKIYRNSNGQHKVVAPIRAQQVDINNAFGGIFANIFSGDVGN